ncbi:MAG: putative metal-binding motif-containing protein, partial [Myxococcota bacterium]
MRFPGLLLALLLTACDDPSDPKPDDTAAPSSGEDTDTDADGDGVSAEDGDCDDDNASVSPNADERCDGVDNDCDGSVDEDDAVDASDWYADTDRDGFGDPAASQTACEAPTGTVENREDCDDTNKDTFPGADEFCDLIDNDCDGTSDEDDAVDAIIFYRDTDRDGFGDPTQTTAACIAPAGHVSLGTDCDDDNETTFPGADEFCDTVDNDCDGTTDEDDAIDAPTWYIDGDTDGFGDASTATRACAVPDGYVSD